MSRANDGGAAFPGEKRVLRMGYESKETEPVPGMTLRDYFAAKAMQGTLADSSLELHDVDGFAVWCYGMADAMLKARKQ